MCATDVWVLILVAKIKTQVVDDVSGILDNVGSLIQLFLGSLAAEVLERDDPIGMGGSRQSGQDALLGEEQRSSANRQEGTFAGGIFLLDLAVSGNQAKGLSIGLQDGCCVSAETTTSNVSKYFPRTTLSPNRCCQGSQTPSQGAVYCERGQLTYMTTTS